MIIRTLEDINQLINARIEENLTLEYKKKLGNNNEIAKEVCAFANSEGGTLIYGVDSKDRIPTSLSWIEGDNVEERIQNVVSTYIQPTLEGVCVFRYPKPNDLKQAVFVVEVPKSPHMPHMSNHRYYKRRGSISSPMDHDEVKNAMLGPGRTAALRFEISANLKLLNKTYTLFEGLFAILPEKRHRVALVPFHTDAWNAIVASGLLLSFPESTTKNLLEAYAIIHEVNSLIDWLKLEKEPIVHTSAYEDSFKEHGTYIPSIIRDKVGRLTSLLQQVDERL